MEDKKLIIYASIIILILVIIVTSDSFYYREQYKKVVIEKCKEYGYSYSESIFEDPHCFEINEKGIIEKYFLNYGCVGFFGKVNEKECYFHK